MIYTLVGEPIALSRPRFTRLGHTYNPQQVQQNEARLQLHLQHKNYQTITSPLSLSVTFFMPIPKNTAKKNLEKTIGSPHYKRPDIDNLIKWVLDCAQGIIFTDDSLVYSVTSQKIYDIVPRTEFTISVLGDDNED